MFKTCALAVCCFLAPSSLKSTRLLSLQQQCGLQPPAVHSPVAECRVRQVLELTAKPQTPPEDNDDTLVDTTAETVSSDETNTTEPPKYKPSDEALDVFSNPYFYENEQLADYATEKRKQVLQNMTVGEIYRKFIRGQKKSNEIALSDFAYLILASPESIRRFFAPAMLSPEEALAAKKLVIFSNQDEVKVCDQRFVEKLPTLEDVMASTIAKRFNNDIPSRGQRLCLVLGPSGSGKTCFALKYLTGGDFLNYSGLKNVTVYVYAKDLKVELTEGKPQAAKEMINVVMERCGSAIDQKIEGPLQMHVCLIIDEAGSSSTKEWFECRENLNRLYAEAQALATSVVVVVVGTGITGRQLSSTEDAYFFRMQTWKEGDLSKILEREATFLRLVNPENVTTVANAIVSHPTLSPLASNARSAYYLVQAIVRLSKGCTRSSWEMQLDEWTPALVTDVVNGYVASNGLASLNAIQRRRVAAFVFYALQQLKPGDTTLPTFEGLEDAEKQAAESLIQYNVEAQSLEKRVILPSETFAFTVTPAIVVILYSLAGVYATLLPGWQNEEEIAALYMVRRLILQWMNSYSSGVSTKYQLDKSLGKIRLLRLQTKLESKGDTVSVPMVDGSTVMINADKASFADIIGPSTLIQAKRRVKGTLEVKLYDELEKCGLLQGDCDDRLLRGLLAMWQGTIDLENGFPPSDSGQSKPKGNSQLSKAFPENLLSLVPPPDRIRFAAIQKADSANMTMENGTSIELPVVDGITFIVSTNAATINLKLEPSKNEEKGNWKSGASTPSTHEETLGSTLGAMSLSTKVTTEKKSKVGGSTGKNVPVVITEDVLNDDMEIDVDRLTDQAAKEAWTSFLRDKIRKGVKVAFLFTTGSTTERSLQE